MCTSVSFRYYGTQWPLKYCRKAYFGLRFIYEIIIKLTKQKWFHAFERTISVCELWLENGNHLFALWGARILDFNFPEFLKIDKKFTRVFGENCRFSIIWRNGCKLRLFVFVLYGRRPFVLYSFHYATFIVPFIPKFNTKNEFFYATESNTKVSIGMRRQQKCITQNNRRFLLK